MVVSLTIAHAANALNGSRAISPFAVRSIKDISS